MATRQTTKKPLRRRKAPELTKAQVAANWKKWFRENQERLGLDPRVLTKPGWMIPGRTKQPEYPAPHFTKRERKRQRDDVRTALRLIAADLDGQTIRQAAAATGEPLVTGLPAEFAGQLTETLGGCWKWHGEHRPGRGIFSPRPICKGVFVYRLLFVALRGPVAPGKQLHHRCYRGWCANPWHTEPLTKDEHLEKHTPSIAWLRAAGLCF